ncbi:MAG TPA: pyridoxamine 5'-phosphate oxidase family protein [Flavobacterium sp.]|jgi:general stress protein 26|nr:pyridoxamine 5'-phosphate oxidase family protein [Flavobacterium sp.]
MNSINNEQPEENYKDIVGAEALKKIKELAEKAGSCFFCTKITTGQAFETRPMAAENIDDEGNFWFLSPSDSYKNIEILADPAVQLLFQGSSHSDFLTLYGHATISTDRQKIEELWNPMLKTWFTEGIDDPRITVIKFAPSGGYYWDTKHAKPVAMLKRAYGAITGQTTDDSIEGTVSI